MFKLMLTCEVVPPFALPDSAGWSLSHWDWSATRRALNAATRSFAFASGSVTILIISSTRVSLSSSGVDQPRFGGASVEITGAVGTTSLLSISSAARRNGDLGILTPLLSHRFSNTLEGARPLFTSSAPKEVYSIAISTNYSSWLKFW